MAKQSAQLTSKIGLVDIQKALLKPKVQLTQSPTIILLLLKPNIPIPNMLTTKPQTVLKVIRIQSHTV